MKVWIEGFEDEFVVRLHHIHPEHKETVEHISDNHLKNDGKLIFEPICGKCGKIGHINNVPNDIIKLYGFKPLDNKVKVVSTKKSLFKRIFKKGEK